MLDMYQCSTLMDFDTKLVGVTNDYKQTANSDVVVITSGIPRKPGMTREELIGTNANIMKGVIENVVKYSPRAIIIVVANPMDTRLIWRSRLRDFPKTGLSAWVAPWIRPVSNVTWRKPPAPTSTTWTAW